MNEWSVEQAELSRVYEKLNNSQEITDELRTLRQLNERMRTESKQLARDHKALKQQFAEVLGKFQTFLSEQQEKQNQIKQTYE